MAEDSHQEGKHARIRDSDSCYGNANWGILPDPCFTPARPLAHQDTPTLTPHYPPNTCPKYVI